MQQINTKCTEKFLEECDIFLQAACLMEMYDTRNTHYV